MKVIITLLFVLSLSQIVTDISYAHSGNTGSSGHNK
jgi:hypothetical protein